MTDRWGKPKVYTIPTGTPFLPTLVDALLVGRFGALSVDPLALADVTIYLPTRRAARALEALFLARAGRATVLPVIRPIGDIDETETLLEAGESPAERLVLPLAMPRLSRALILASLVLAWGRAGRGPAVGATPLRIPASPADAFGLANDLAALIDDMETASVPFSALSGIVPEEHAAYWQATLTFLGIAFEAWPAHLLEIGRADPAARRDRLIRDAAQRLAAHPPSAPVIAAGSTGSVPATAELLATIARLPSGAVVLPGLDQTLDAEGWDAVGGPGSPASSHGHPQFGLKRLLGALGLPREEVLPLGVPPAPLARRSRFLTEALRPAETTDRWAEFGGGDRQASLAGVGLIEARTEGEEALAIALALREAVEAPGTVAALVTPDRSMARRVAIELRRWGLEIDDSAGIPLDATAAGTFARLLLEAALSDADPVALLALARHPLAAFGMARPDCRRAASALELGVLRGERLTGGFEGLATALAERQAETEAGTARIPAARRRLTPEDWAAAGRLVGAFAEAFRPLTALPREADVATLAAAVVAAADSAAKDETGSANVLWLGAEGEALAALLEGLSAPEARALVMAPAEFPAFLGAAMHGVAVRPRPGADPRIHIWGVLEARLQSVDLMILGGLDEGVWPAETRTDPWLSRSMRTAIGLEPPERRIGQSAHDLVGLLGTPRVLLSRALKRGGSPTTASRWLLRIEALAGKEGSAALREGGARYVALARALDAASPEPAPARPDPKPPVAARPRRLSITEIETLVRDPYHIYARHVLALDPLDPLGAEPDYAERGTLIHDALATFIVGWRGRPFDASAEAALLDVGRDVFASLDGFPEAKALWWPRFVAIARWFVSFERDRDGDVAERRAELGGRLELALPGGSFRLTGRADRVDLLRDGSVAIFDFKTGAPPSATQVLTGFAPQLALEAAMVRRGAFGEAFAGRRVSKLAWLGLGRVRRGNVESPALERNSELDEDGLAERVFAETERLLAAYDREERGYLSQARPMFERRFPGDYDHLARVDEWRLGGDGEGDTG